jgi:hypothetical protein
VVGGARTVRGLRLGFQSLRTEAQALPVADLSTRSQLSGVEVSGYVGLDLLEGNRLILDTRARRVEVAPGAKK